jgi:hypothetical protein
MLWIPPGFAHGFVVVSENAQVLYKASDYYDAVGFQEHICRIRRPGSHKVAPREGPETFYFATNVVD